jgi:predicted peptidase
VARPVGSVPGAPLGYLEYLPPRYGDGDVRPLLLFLHGSNQNGNGSERQLQRLTATAVPRLIAHDAWPADRSFIVLMPQHRQRPGSLCPDAHEIAQFLKFALDHYAVDRSRVYLTGLSCGAIGAWAYLGRHTDQLVTAAVLIAGDGRPAFRRAGCALGRVAIWAFHGKADAIVPASGSRVPINKLNACTHPPPTDARLTLLAGAGHFIWNPIYDLTLGYDVYDWLLRHANPAA